MAPWAPKWGRHALFRRGRILVLSFSYTNRSNCSLHSHTATVFDGDEPWSQILLRASVRVGAGVPDLVGDPHSHWPAHDDGIREKSAPQNLRPGLCAANQAANTDEIVAHSNCRRVGTSILIIDPILFRAWLVQFLAAVIVAPILADWCSESDHYTHSLQKLGLILELEESPTQISRDNFWWCTKQCFLH